MKCSRCKIVGHTRPKCKELLAGMSAPIPIEKQDKCTEELKIAVQPSIINIGLYADAFKEYHPDLISFAETNNISLIPLKSMRGQALALMSHPEVRGQKYIGRDEADGFFRNIQMDTKDAIQQFNKATGLKRMNIRGYYCLRYPFEADTTDIDKRKGVSIGADKTTSVNSIKEWFRKYIVDVPTDEWQVGHLDPTINDASETNLAYQPPIQGKFRDRFKFDRSFIKMWPTAAELIPKIDRFYTENEQRNILAALKQKFDQ
jgi:hypothetical protein